MLIVLGCAAMVPTPLAYPYRDLRLASNIMTDCDVAKLPMLKLLTNGNTTVSLPREP